MSTTLSTPFDATSRGISSAKRITTRAERSLPGRDRTWEVVAHVCGRSATQTDRDVSGVSLGVRRYTQTVSKYSAPRHRFIDRRCRHASRNTPTQLYIQEGYTPTRARTHTHTYGPCNPHAGQPYLVGQHSFRSTRIFRFGDIARGRSSHPRIAHRHGTLASPLYSRDFSARANRCTFLTTNVARALECVATRA